jgi:hypothetical protein
MFALSKKAVKRLVHTSPALALLLVAQAHAVTTPIDTTDIVGGVSAAGVAITAVIMALIALSTAIFGLVKVYGFVSRRAGA